MEVLTPLPLLEKGEPKLLSKVEAVKNETSLVTFMSNRKLPS